MISWWRPLGWRQRPSWFIRAARDILNSSGQSTAVITRLTYDLWPLTNEKSFFWISTRKAISIRCFGIIWGGGGAIAFLWTAAVMDVFVNKRECLLLSGNHQLRVTLDYYAPSLLSSWSLLLFSLCAFYIFSILKSSNRKYVTGSCSYYTTTPANDCARLFAYYKGNSVKSLCWSSDPSVDLLAAFYWSLAIHVSLYRFAITIR